MCSFCSVFKRRSLLFHIYADNIQRVLTLPLPSTSSSFFFLFLPLLSYLIFSVISPPGVRREISLIHQVRILRPPSSTIRTTFSSFDPVDYFPGFWYYLRFLLFLFCSYSRFFAHMPSHSSFSESHPSFPRSTVSNQTTSIFHFLLIRLLLFPIFSHSSFLSENSSIHLYK